MTTAVVYRGPTKVDLVPYRPSKLGSQRKNKEVPRDILPILGIDPGGKTGWSLLVLRRAWCGKDIFELAPDVMLEHKIKWDHGEISCPGNEDLAAYQIMRLIEDWPSAAIVMEDFILRANRHEMNRDLLAPVRIIAKVEHHCWRVGRKMFLQQPSFAKTTVTDERLRLWNCYTSEGGLGHARDADRHVLTFMRRCMDKKSGRTIKPVAWQHIYGNNGG
jgi:hypothetical protein